MMARKARPTMNEYPVIGQGCGACEQIPTGWLIWLSSANGTSQMVLSCQRLCQRSGGGKKSLY